MKKNSIAGFLAMAVASAGLLSGTNTFAITPAQADSLRTALAQTATPEMPGKAADLVSTAKVDERSDVAQVVVRAAVDRRPTIAASVVAAVATKSPGVSAISAVEAALLQPKQLVVITKAAVHAAPGQAGEIVAALCQKFAQQYNTIALAANEAAPQSGKAILLAVAKTIPALQPTIDHSLVGGAVDVASVILQTEQVVVAAASSQNVSPTQLLTGSAAMSVPTMAASGSGSATPIVSLAPPVVGPPFQTNSPVIVNPTNVSFVVPTNGVSYNAQ